MRVLSRLFRRRFLEELAKIHAAGQLKCSGELAGLVGANAFARWLASLRGSEWVVYAKRPFAGPEAVLAYRHRWAGDCHRGPAGVEQTLTEPAARPVIRFSQQYAACLSFFRDNALNDNF